MSGLFPFSGHFRLNLHIINTVLPWMNFDMACERVIGMLRQHPSCEVSLNILCNAEGHATETYVTGHTCKLFEKHRAFHLTLLTKKQATFNTMEDVQALLAEIAPIEAYIEEIPAQVPGVRLQTDKVVMYDVEPLMAMAGGQHTVIEWMIPLKAIGVRAVQHP